MTRIGFVLSVVLAAGIAVFYHYAMVLEARSANREVVRIGHRLVNLMSLHSLEGMEPQRRELLVRTFIEQVHADNLAYLFVHDGDGRAFVSVASKDLAIQVPSEVRARSLNALGFQQQVFESYDPRATVYEFSKPLIQDASRAATIRLGLVPSIVPMFSPQRLSLVGMVCFLMIATAVVGYYIVMMTLRQLHTATLAKSRDTGGAEATEHPGTGVMPVLRELDAMIDRLQDDLNTSRNANAELESWLGVSAFEKDQALRVLDILNLGIIILDAQDHITHVNTRMLKVLRTDGEQVRDKAVSQVIQSQEILAFLSEHDTPADPGAENTVDVELPELAPGQVFQVAVATLKGSAGEAIGKLVSLRNVTRSRLAEKAQQEFITHVAHELLTPLTSIMTYSEVLMDGEVTDPDAQKEFYNTINEETQRLAALIRNLLNISKMQAGALVLDTGLVRTDSIIEVCLPSVEASAADKGIKLETRLPEKFPSLKADKELLKAALINILGNAVKYTPQGGKIGVMLYEDEGSAVFDITDTGVGISAEDLPRVFDRFYRSSDTKVREQSGSGLGLAIAAEIVRLHHGSIDVKSEPGKGAQFVIRIPVEGFSLEGE